jgi:hypothetical protein
MTKLKARQAMRSAMAALGLGLVIATGLNPTQAQAENGCRSVCITELGRNGSNLRVAWTGEPQFVSYQVYWERVGTLEVRSEGVGADQRAFDIAGVQPGATYRVQVMGCTAHIPIFATSACGSNVDERTITT